MNDIKFTTIDELIKLESLRARKKPPCDLQLNEKEDVILTRLNNINVIKKLESFK